MTHARLWILEQCASMQPHLCVCVCGRVPMFAYMNANRSSTLSDIHILFIYFLMEELFYNVRFRWQSLEIAKK